MSGVLLPPPPPSGCPSSVDVEGASGHAEPFPPRSVGAMAGWGGGTTCPPILCVGEVRAPSGRKKEQGEQRAESGFPSYPPSISSSGPPLPQLLVGPASCPAVQVTSSPGV